MFIEKSGNFVYYSFIAARVRARKIVFQQTSDESLFSEIYWTRLKTECFILFYAAIDLLLMVDMITDNVD